MNNYCTTNERFINPYNFVSINEKVRREKVEYGSLSGTIVCELETLSPLFTPNTTRNHFFSDKFAFANSYDFFSYEDLQAVDNPREHFARPIIPGSSIRGVIRSAYEAALNGCMSTCDDENTLYRRTPVPRDSYGIIEKDATTGERVLYKASKWKWPISDRRGHKTGDELRGGVYLRGEDFPDRNKPKKHDAIMKYELDSKGNKIEIARFDEEGENNREWTNFVEVWRLYQQRGGAIKGVNQNKNHKGYASYFDAKAIPVYYTRLDNTSFYYLSPAAITKEVFSRTLKELLKSQGEHNPCEHLSDICPACALFGMTGEDSLASRLMFCDGTPNISGGLDTTKDWSDWYDKLRALPILASPKVSATEFYLEDVDGAAYFNYDYIVNYYEYFDKNNKTAKEAVRTPLENPKLRGRKFYWHRKSILEDKTQAFGNQRTEVRPVKKGKSFTFKIAFDRLTKDELQTLLWVLTFGEHNLTHAHKFGFGKPYGYGSARVTCTEVSIVTLDENLTLKKETQCSYVPVKPEDTTALREYLKLTDYSKASDDVKYPKGSRNSGRGGSGKIIEPSTYAWFGINKEILLGGFNPTFNQVLPNPLDENIALWGYARGSGEVENNRAKIKPAPVPETQSAVPHIKKEEPTSNEVKRSIISKVEKVQEATPYGQYKAAEFKNWLTPYNKSPKIMKKLEEFVSDYERAQAEGDNRYKDIAQFYEKAKGKLQNG